MSDESENSIETAPDNGIQPAAQTPADDLSKLLEDFDTAIDRRAAEPPATDEPHAIIDEQGQYVPDPVIEARNAAALEYRRNNELEARLAQVQHHIEQQQFEKDLADTVKAVRGEHQNYPDEFVQAWIDLQARRDPALATAFQMRADDPVGWRQAQTALAKRFHAHAQANAIDHQTTADVAAVAAAVRAGAGAAPAPSAPNYGRMSNSELRGEYEKLGISPPF